MRTYTEKQVLEICANHAHEHEKWVRNNIAEQLSKKAQYNKEDKKYYIELDEMLSMVKI